MKDRILVGHALKNDMKVSSASSSHSILSWLSIMQLHYSITGKLFKKLTGRNLERSVMEFIWTDVYCELLKCWTEMKLIVLKCTCLLYHWQNIAQSNCRPNVRSAIYHLPVAWRKTERLFRPCTSIISPYSWWMVLASLFLLCFFPITGVIFGSTQKADQGHSLLPTLQGADEGESSCPGAQGVKGWSHLNHNNNVNNGSFPNFSLLYYV